jgi:hypothetical protein
MVGRFGGRRWWLQRRWQGGEPRWRCVGRGWAGLRRERGRSRRLGRRRCGRAVQVFDTGRAPGCSQLLLVCSVGALQNDSRSVSFFRRSRCIRRLVLTTASAKEQHRAGHRNDHASAANAATRIGTTVAAPLRPIGVVISTNEREVDRGIRAALRPKAGRPLVVSRYQMRSAWPVGDTGVHCCAT